MEIKWEPQAETAFLNIIEYRFKVAGKYSARRLSTKILKAAGRLEGQPEMGPKESSLEGFVHRSYRSVVADKHYKIIYRIESGTIYISALFDCRQDPENLKKEIKQ